MRQLTREEFKPFGDAVQSKLGDGWAVSWASYPVAGPRPEFVLVGEVAYGGVIKFFCSLLPAPVVSAEQLQIFAQCASDMLRRQF